jgi:hypothetical protein
MLFRGIYAVYYENHKKGKGKAIPVTGHEGP